MLKGYRPVGLAVEDTRAIGVVVADHEIDMPVAIDIGKGRRVAVPAFAWIDDIACDKVLSRKSGRMHSRFAEAQKGDRRSAPVIDQDVDQTVFVDIRRQAAHRCRHGRDVDQRARLEIERRIAIPGPGRRRHDHPVCARVDIANIVGQTIAIEVVQRDRCAGRRDPGGDPLQARMDGAHIARLARCRLRQSVLAEGKALDHLRTLVARQIRQPCPKVERRHERQRSEARRVHEN